MISDLIFHLFWYSSPVFFVCLVWKCHAWRWARIARAYRAVDSDDGDFTTAPAKRSKQTLILVADGVGRISYPGIATVSVTQEGILLELVRPFSLFHPPLLIPFADCHAEPTRLNLIGKTVQYTLSQVANVKINIHDNLQDWIESRVAILAAEEEAPSESGAVQPKSFACH